MPTVADRRPDGAGPARSPVGRLVTERARPARVREWRQGWWLAVATVCFGAFMGQLDASIVTLTYRPIRAQFHASLASVEWVSLAYLVALVAFLVPVGRLSDSYGRKLLYLYGFVVFMGGSAVCGFAPDLDFLIVFRIVQAVGAALLQANSVALVTTSAPPERMRAALGVQAGAQALGLALGPTIGGLLVGTVGWRWVYFINLPVGLVAVVAGYYLLPRTRQRCSAAGFDWVGVGLLALASTTLLLGVSAASGLSLPAGADAASFGLALLSSWAFVHRQRRTSHPLVDLSLLADRAVSSGLVGALCGYLVLFGPLVLVPIILTNRGLSDLGAGVILTALPAGFAAAATVTNRFLPSLWTERQRALLGTAVAIVALGAGLFAPLTPEALVPLLAFAGLGLGTFTPSNNTAIMTAIPARSSGTGGGLLNMTRGLGTALGVSVVALALHLGGAGGGFNRDRLAFAVLVLGGVGAMIATWVSPRQRM